jgi:hypothetical protein
MRHVEFITFHNTELKVEYDYYPAEPAVHYYADHSGYPGCSESFEIIKISTTNGDDVTDLCKGMYDDIEEYIKKQQTIEYERE